MSFYQTIFLFGQFIIQIFSKCSFHMFYFIFETFEPIRTNCYQWLMCYEITHNRTLNNHFRKNWEKSKLFTFQYATQILYTITQWWHLMHCKIQTLVTWMLNQFQWVMNTYFDWNSNGTMAPTDQMALKGERGRWMSLTQKQNVWN